MLFWINGVYFVILLQIELFEIFDINRKILTIYFLLSYNFWIEFYFDNSNSEVF